MAEFRSIGAIQQGLIPVSTGPTPIKPEIVSRQPQQLFYVGSGKVVDKRMCFTKHKKIAYGWCVGRHKIATPETNRVIRWGLKKGISRIWDIMLRQDPLTGNKEPRRCTERRKRKLLQKNFATLAQNPNDLYCRVLNIVYEMSNRFKYNHVSQTQIALMAGELEENGKKLARQTVNLYLRAAEYFGHLIVVPQRHRYEANTYFFPIWAMDVATCYSLAPYLPALADESHLRVTPTIQAYVNNLISLFQEKVSIPLSSYLVQATDITMFWNRNSQKVKNFDWEEDQNDQE
jgi:hypothetical protein